MAVLPFVANGFIIISPPSLLGGGSARCLEKGKKDKLSAGSTLLCVIASSETSIFVQNNLHRCLLNAIDFSVASFHNITFLRANKTHLRREISSNLTFKFYEHKNYQINHWNCLRMRKLL